MIAGAIDQWFHRSAAEEATGAYLTWWQECTAVRDAYRAWRGAPREYAALAFAGYAAALDREQRAADAFAELARRLGEQPRPSPA